MVASLHLDAVTPNFLIQEAPNLPDGYIKGISLQGQSLPNGFFALPSEPGLGIELDDAALEGKLFDGAFDVPGPGNLYKMPDGSAAEW